MQERGSIEKHRPRGHGDSTSYKVPASKIQAIKGGKSQKKMKEIEKKEG